MAHVNSLGHTPSSLARCGRTSEPTKRPFVRPGELVLPFSKGPRVRVYTRHFTESRPSVLANSMTFSTCVGELSEDPGDRSEWLLRLETAFPVIPATCPSVPCNTSLTLLHQLV